MARITTELSSRLVEFFRPNSWVYYHSSWIKLDIYWHIVQLVKVQYMTCMYLFFHFKFNQVDHLRTGFFFAGMTCDSNWAGMQAACVGSQYRGWWRHRIQPVLFDHHIGASTLSVLKNGTGSLNDCIESWPWFIGTFCSTERLDFLLDPEGRAPPTVPPAPLSATS